MIKKGYSLIELLVASAITAGLAVVLTGVLSSVFSGFRYNYQSGLLSAQMTAIKEQAVQDIRRSYTDDGSNAISPRMCIKQLVHDTDGEISPKFTGDNSGSISQGVSYELVNDSATNSSKLLRRVYTNSACPQSPASIVPLNSEDLKITKFEIETIHAQLTHLTIVGELNVSDTERSDVKKRTLKPTVIDTFIYHPDSSKIVQ